MTDRKDAEPVVRGTLGVLDGRGVVRVEIRVDTDPREVWAAVTQPERLAGWAGKISGDLRAGGEYRALLFPSEWDGGGRILECEPGHRWLIRGSEPGGTPHDNELTLIPDGSGTIVTLTQSGMELDKIKYYGVGVQIHLENLASYLAGDGAVDPDPFWQKLLPDYERAATELGRGT